MSDNYMVERTTTISAPPATVFAKISDLTQWDQWSPWAHLDPDMTVTHAGDPASVGQHYAWSGNRKVGEGNMTITNVDAPNEVELDLHFLKPFKSESDLTWRVEPEGDGSRVIWNMTGANTFMIKMMARFGKGMDKQVGPDFEAGLAKLKQLLET